MPKSVQSYSKHNSLFVSSSGIMRCDLSAHPETRLIVKYRSSIEMILTFNTARWIEKREERVEQRGRDHRVE